MVADVARARKRVRIFLSHVEVPHLTVGPSVRGRCEPAHIGGRKFLRSTAQMKEACQVPLGATSASERTRSALPLRADMATADRFGFVPTGDINCRDCDVRSLAVPEPDRQV